MRSRRRSRGPRCRTPDIGERFSADIGRSARVNQAPLMAGHFLHRAIIVIRMPRAFSLIFRYEPHGTDHREGNDVRKNKQKQIRIWGRANSVNVQKALWCLSELGLSYERIDAGMAFGRNHDADYLAMNPNARVPTLVDGDFVLWESNSIMRYLVLAYAQGSPIYPDAPKLRAGVVRLLDWPLSTLQPIDRPVFSALDLTTLVLHY